jgi:hypothetical protein
LVNFVLVSSVSVNSVSVFDFGFLCPPLLMTRYLLIFAFLQLVHPLSPHLVHGPRSAGLGPPICRPKSVAQAQDFCAGLGQAGRAGLGMLRSTSDKF